MSSAGDLTRRVHDADKAATPGPWSSKCYEDDGHWSGISVGTGKTRRVIVETLDAEDADLIASYRSDAVVLARMVDDVLNRHHRGPAGTCAECKDYPNNWPCETVEALDRIAKEAQP